MEADAFPLGHIGFLSQELALLPDITLELLARGFGAVFALQSFKPSL